MTYIDLINRFWELDEAWQFSCCETRLYFYLLKTANRLGWGDNWTHSDDKTAANVGVSKNTFKTARNRLSQAGLISFKEGGKGYGNKTRYQITYQNMTPKPEPKVDPKLQPKPEPKVDPIYNKTKIKTKNKESTDVDEKVEVLYSLYPAKCVVNAKRNLGKGSKDKEKIEKLLKVHSFEDLKKTIEWYIGSCRSSQTFMKNFSTFLNNLPDIPDGNQVKALFNFGPGEWIGADGKRYYGNPDKPLPAPIDAPPRPDVNAYFDMELGRWNW